MKIYMVTDYILPTKTLSERKMLPKRYYCVTRNGASVKLQSLLDNIVYGIFLALDKEKLHALNNRELVCISFV